MDSDDIKSYLISAFKYWIMTTKLRDFRQHFMERIKSSIASISEICDIINQSLCWQETPLGYDGCSLLHFEWTVYSILLYERFIHQNDIKRYISVDKDVFEHFIYMSWQGALSRYRASNFWRDRKKQRSAVILKRLFEEFSNKDSLLENVDKELSIIHFFNF